MACFRVDTVMYSAIRLRKLVAVTFFGGMKISWRWGKRAVKLWANGLRTKCSLRAWWQYVTQWHGLIAVGNNRSHVFLPSLSEDVWAERETEREREIKKKKRERDWKMCRAAGNLGEGNSAGGVLRSARCTARDLGRLFRQRAFPLADLSTVTEPAVLPVHLILMAARTSHRPQSGQAIEQHSLHSKNESCRARLKKLTLSGGIFFIRYL